MLLDKIKNLDYSILKKAKNSERIVFLNHEFKYQEDLFTERSLDLQVFLFRMDKEYCLEFVYCIDKEDDLSLIDIFYFKENLINYDDLRQFFKESYDSAIFKKMVYKMGF